MAEQYTRQVNIYVDSGQALNAYDALVAKNDKLSKSEENARAKLEALKKSLETTTDKDAISKLNKDIKATEVSLDKLTASQKANGEQIDRLSKKLSGELSPSYKDLVNTAQRLNRELKTMSEQDPNFDKIKTQSIAANKAVSDYGVSMGKLKSSFKEFASEAGKIATGVLIGSTVQAGIQYVVAGIQGAVKAQKDLSRELTNIAKVTGLTDSEVKSLNSSLKDLDTATPSKRLRELAVEAGKLGIEGVNNIRKFVKEADIINVALGEDLGADAVSNIQKLSSIYKTEMLNIGSALNDIEQKSSASATFQVDFLSRLAGVAQTAQLSSDAVLGYGSALEQLKQPVEASSTALNTFFIEFVRDTEKFGASAGFARGELSKLLSEKGTNEAFLQFLTRIKEGSASSQDLLGKLQAMGIDGARGASTFLALANNIELVKNQQLIANDAIKNGTSITQEYNRVNNDLSSNLDKAGKKIAAFFAPLSNALGSMLGKLFESTKTATDLFNEQDSKVKNLTTSLNPLLEKYEALKGKTNRTKEEQLELNKTIQDIAKIMPSAVTEFDKYGKAMDINADKVRGLMEAEKRRLAIYNKNAINDSKAELKVIEDKVAAIIKLQNYTLNAKFEDQGQTVKFTDEKKNPILAKLAADLQEATDKAKELKLDIQALKGEAIDVPGVKIKNNLTVDDGQLGGGDNGAAEKAKAKADAKAARIEKEMQDQLDAQRAFREKVLELSIAHRAAMDQEDETEVARIAIKFRRLRAELEKNYPILTDAARELQAELALIEGEQTIAAVSDAEYKATLKTVQKFYADKKAEVEKDFADGLINEKTMHATIRGFAEQEVDAKVNIARDYVEKSKEAAADITAFEAEQADMRVEIRREELRRIQEEKDRAFSEKDAQLGNDQYNAGKTYGLGDDKEADQARLEEKYQYDMDKAIEAGNSTVAIELAHAEAKDSIDQEYTQKKWARASQYVSAAGNLLTSFLSAQTDAESAADAKALAKDKKANDEKKNQYKKQLDQKLISQKQYDALVSAADEDMAAKEAEFKKREFERNKQMKLKEILINTAVGIMAAIAQSPMTGGLPGSAIAALAGGIQYAAVASQQAPELEKGGLLEGERHSNGGTPIFDKKSGRLMAIGEVGEMVLSRNFVEANAPLVPTLLDASRNGSSLLDMISTRAPSISTEEILSNMRLERGGIVGGSENKSTAAAPAGDDDVKSILKSIDTRMQRIEQNGLIDYNQLARAGVEVIDAMNLEI